MQTVEFFFYDVSKLFSILCKLKERYLKPAKNAEINLLVVYTPKFQQ